MRAPTKKQTLLVLATPLLLGCILFFSNHSSEPTYQGRPLTKWLEDACIASRPNPNIGAAQYRAARDAGERAVVAIGTNGIPTLLRLLTYKDSPFKTKMLSLLDSQSFIHADFLRDYERHLMAGAGFALLGTNAQPAFRDLVHISQSSNLDSKFWATQLLEHSLFIGKPPLPLLIKTLQDPRPDVREEITNMIIKFYPEEASKLQLTKTNSH